MLNTNVYTCGYVGCLKKKLSPKYQCHIVDFLRCEKSKKKFPGCGKTKILTQDVRIFLKTKTFIKIFGWLTILKNYFYKSFSDNHNMKKHTSLSPLVSSDIFDLKISKNIFCSIFLIFKIDSVYNSNSLIESILIDLYNCF